MPPRRLRKRNFLIPCLLLVFFVTEVIAGSGRVSPPNIVLIVVDTLRRDHLGVYGHPVETMPFVAAKAGQGLIFINYYSNSSETVASHGSLFSGRLCDPYVSRIDRSFVADLKKAGYRTYGISANPLVNGFFQFNLGFDAFESEPPPDRLNGRFLTDRLRRLEDDSGQKDALSDFLRAPLSTTADLINPRIYERLEKHMSGSVKAPFFLFINYLDPHDPYFPHEKSSLLGNYNIRDEKGRLRSILCDGDKITAERQKELARLYDGEIKYVDLAISRLYRWMESRALGKDTIFVVTSDHGELLGENRLYARSLALYSEEPEIPMIVFGKDIGKGRVDHLMSHMDTGSLITSLVSHSTTKYLKGRRRTELIAPWRARIPGAHVYPKWDASSFSALPERNRTYSIISGSGQRSSACTIKGIGSSRTTDMAGSPRPNAGSSSARSGARSKRAR